MINELHQFRPKLTGYIPELSFAEKLVIMANKGEGNTRVKDFYDLFMLCDQNPQLDPRKLKEEIRRVFKNRGVTPAYPEVLKTGFVYSKDKAAFDRAWNNLMRKIGVSVRLGDVLRNLEHFLRRNYLSG